MALINTRTALVKGGPRIIVSLVQRGLLFFYFFVKP